MSARAGPGELSTAAAARRLETTKMSVRDLIRRGRLAATKRDGRWWLDAAEVEALAAERWTPRIRSVLTRGQVEEIKARLRRGEGQTALAAEYGVSRTTIHFIAHGATWGDVRAPGGGM